MRTPAEIYRSLERRRAMLAQCPGRHSAALDLAEYVRRYLEVRGRGDIGERALRDLMLCVAPDIAAEEDARAEALWFRIRDEAESRHARHERAWWRRALRAIGIGRRRAS